MPLVLALLLLAFPAFADKKPVTDEHIYDQVRLVLASDRDVRGAHLDVAVDKGVVTLRGEVESEKAKKRAAKLAKKVDGVTEVVNELTIR